MNSAAQTQSTLRETFQLESGRLVEEVTRIMHEGNVRRIVVKQGEQTIVEFPLAIGVVGTLLAAPLAALGALAVLLNDCTIEVEREEAAPATEPDVGQSNAVLGSAELPDKPNGTEVVLARTASADNSADGQPFDTLPEVAPVSIQPNTAAVHLQSMVDQFAAESSGATPA